VAKAWIERANASGVPVLALDIPSGLDAASGVAQSTTVRAERTATFIALKPGLLTADGPDYCGCISVHDLELTAAVAAAAQGRRLDWSSLRLAIPARVRRTQRNVNKGSFGSLAIVGGGAGMVGAAVLAGRAALHLGAGKVWVGMAGDNIPAVDWVQPELMLQRASDVVTKQADALVIGPGLGTGDVAHRLVADALSIAAPLLLDADALNLLALDQGLFTLAAKRAAATIVTPHPGEAARLMQTTTVAIQADRLGAARDLAARLHACVVLKGAGTVIARPDGRFAINASGGPALASGGTGDVLSGMLGALLAQGIDACEAAELAVCLHGAAADALVVEGNGPAGLTASELGLAARRLLNAS
jgi:ADP-dependent NAD(P)H-hydrate dehydratase / NAD(P)H-hydrate epimerase